MLKIATVLIIWAIPLIALRVYMNMNEGFFPTAITKDVINASWEVENTIDESHILSQPYDYLGKGCQTFVFASEDGKYVIKFFKEKHLIQQQWLNWLPIPGWFKHSKLEGKIRKRDLLFDGCKLAFNHLKKECGLIYMHLCKKEIPIRTLLIRDKLGTSYEIDLQRSSFYVQLRGIPFVNALKEMSEIEIQDMMQKTARLLDSRSQKGIQDHDPALFQNLAIVDKEPIFIDLGQFVEDTRFTLLN